MAGTRSGRVGRVLRRNRRPSSFGLCRPDGEGVGLYRLFLYAQFPRPHGAREHREVPPCEVAGGICGRRGGAAVGFRSIHVRRRHEGPSHFHIVDLLCESQGCLPARDRRARPGGERVEAGTQMRVGPIGAHLRERRRCCDIAHSQAPEAHRGGHQRAECLRPLAEEGPGVAAVFVCDSRRQVPVAPLEPDRWALRGNAGLTPRCEGCLPAGALLGSDTMRYAVDDRRGSQPRALGTSGCASLRLHHGAERRNRPRPAHPTVRPRRGRGSSRQGRGRIS
mmetsp:Transcript_99630/g.281176  ORF Transcript_99630/g.281176 Transcript_99630/m.281176 type:complete len:279 (-) Transcript_99630:1887-2723(-)